MASTEVLLVSQTNVMTPKPEQHLPRWQQIALQKIEERDQAIKKWELKRTVLPPMPLKNVQPWPITSGQLSNIEIDITDSSTTRLLEKLSTGVWTAQEVLQAFIHRAVIAHHLTNPLTEILFDRGMKAAKELDEYFQKSGKVVGPLHGLPISLKDVFHIEGVETTMGYVAFKGDKRATSDPIVERLQSLGAVIYCKTNVPQTLMSGECVNFLFGRTSSPYNTSLSAGGSSGGEGSLISLGGSPLGIGTDIAGSIRTPANFNGIYGLCPTSGRFPSHGASDTHSLFVLNGVAGPLSRSVDGLEVYTRSILASKPWEWDSTCLKLPWNQDEYDEGLGKKGTLCFGIIPHDMIVKPHPPIQRALRDIKAALIAQGHEVIEIPFFEADGMWELMVKLFKCTGGSEIRDIISKYDEPLIKEMDMPVPDDALSASEFLQYGHQVGVLREKYLKKWMASSKLTSTGKPIDAFILPSGGHVAPPHGTMEYFLYEAISNLLDWTCATIPVGFVNSKLDPISEMPFVPMSEWDRRNWERYSPEAYENGPICLQVMGQKHTEEKVLGLLITINKALGRDAQYMAGTDAYCSEF